MKKILFITIVTCFFANVQAQISSTFGTGSTLKKGTFSLGLNPVFVNDNAIFFVHGGLGLKKGLDLAVHYGINDGDDYIGADLEWALLSGKTDISLITGAHQLSDVGIDGGLNVSFDIRKDVAIFTGLDTDLAFHDDPTLYAWVPIGLELFLKSKFSIIIEGDIAVSDNGESNFGGGVVFYF